MLSGKAPLKSYKGNDIKEGEAVNIRGKWLYLQVNQGEALELLGKYSVYEMGWGSSCYRWSDFSAEEKRLLKTTIK